MPRILEVGGKIRDELLGLKSKDVDFVFILDNLDKTASEGFAEMTKWMVDRKYEIFLSTDSVFTIRAKFPKGHEHEGLVADFVMARKEIGYYEGTRNPIVELGTLRDDLIRRDFTVNALCKDEKGEIIDMFNGIEDLKNKILKTPRNPMETLMDDPLRILRAMRFAIVKGFTINQDIWIAMQQKDILEKLQFVVSQERIREEVDKMMRSSTSRTLFLFNEVEQRIPGFTKMIFSNGLWLKPTNEKI